MTDINKLMAEALVEQGYARDHEIDNEIAYIEITSMVRAKIQPFSDTLEGYRQRDCLLNYLMLKHESQYFRVRNLAYARYDTIQDQDKFTITECFGQLAGESDE